MKSPPMNQTFLAAAVTEFGAMPRRGLVYAGAVGLTSATFDLVHWLHRTEAPLDYVGILVLLAVWSPTAYAMSMLMIQARWSWRGFGKFLATTLAVVSPVLLAIAVLLVAKTFAGHAGLVLTIVLAAALSLVGVVLVTLLSGWPILQAVSPRFVGPTAALKATEGLRWPLVMASFAQSALNRAGPNTSTAGDLPTACLFAAVNGLVACGSLMLTVSLAVVAWRHMASRVAYPS